MAGFQTSATCWSEPGIAGENMRFQDPERTCRMFRTCLWSGAPLPMSLGRMTRRGMGATRESLGGQSCAAGVT